MASIQLVIIIIGFFFSVLFTLSLECSFLQSAAGMDGWMLCGMNSKFWFWTWISFVVQRSLVGSLQAGRVFSLLTSAFPSFLGPEFSKVVLKANQQNEAAYFVRSFTFPASNQLHPFTRMFLFLMYGKHGFAWGKKNRRHQDSTSIQHPKKRFSKNTCQLNRAETH